jgi:hypothetical protein
LNFIKKLWIKHLTKKHENAHTHANAVDFKKASKIGVLFTENLKENQENIDNIIWDLKREGKEIVTLAFCKNKKLSIHQYPYFRSNDVKFFGGFNSEFVAEFLNHKFDFVLCLDSKPGISLNYVLSQLDARCRIGIHNEKSNDHFEFIIRSEKNVVLSSNDVMKYLKMIKSNEH